MEYKQQFTAFIDLLGFSEARLGRSLQDLVNFLSELHALKVDLFLKTQGIDTTTPSGKAMFGMLSVFADFERSIIQERVRAGLVRARREGKRLGRPPDQGCTQAAHCGRSKGSSTHRGGKEDSPEVWG
jgi:DNA invertase Pin-like site-specific DNA recombinase